MLNENENVVLESIVKVKNNQSDNTVLTSESLNGFVHRAFVFKACEETDGSKCSPVIECE